MRTGSRLAEILVNAAALSDRMPPIDIIQTEVDTSCPHVPFGFVRSIRLSLVAGQEPDQFWSYAISTDELLDPLSAEIQTLDLSKLGSVVATIHKDLARVGSEQDVEVSMSPAECFSVEKACQHCSGRVLLLRYANEANYVHWHRES